MLRSSYLERLQSAGIRPEDVTHVLCTHLHLDHVGWNARLLDGRWVPTFPQAKYILSRRECEFWDTRSGEGRSEEHTSELQSLMRISYAVFCLKKKTKKIHQQHTRYNTYARY